MAKRVLIPLAEGFEEIEAVALIDVLRRGEVDVIIGGVEGEYIASARNVVIKADKRIEDIDANTLDMIVLPGGYGGTMKLAENQKVQSLIKELNANGKLVGAICAAPIALKEAGVLKGAYTCYPSVEEKTGKENYVADKIVVKSDNVMTSKGPGTAVCFGLEILKELMGESVAKKVKEEMLVNYC